MKDELITRRKREERELSFKTNHDLLRLINNSVANRTIKSKSSLEECFPDSIAGHSNHRSRPGLIERKHHPDIENAPLQSYGNGQKTIVKLQSISRLINSVDKLLRQGDSILPIVKHKIREEINDVHQQMISGVKKIDELIAGESLHQSSQEKYRVDIITLQRKLDSGRQLIRKLQHENTSLNQKVIDLEKKLAKSTPNTIDSVSASNNIVIPSNIAEQKKLRNIMLSQSNIINQQLATIEAHRDQLTKGKDDSNQLHQMLLFQASTIESLLPKPNKYSEIC